MGVINKHRGTYDTVGVQICESCGKCVLPDFDRNVKMGGNWANEVQITYFSSRNHISQQDRNARQIL